MVGGRNFRSVVADVTTRVASRSDTGASLIQEHPLNQFAINVPISPSSCAKNAVQTQKISEPATSS